MREGLLDERLYDAIEVAVYTHAALGISPVLRSALVREVIEDLAGELPDRLDG